MQTGTPHVFIGDRGQRTAVQTRGKCRFKQRGLTPDVAADGLSAGGPRGAGRCGTLALAGALGAPDKANCKEPQA